MRDPGGVKSRDDIRQFQQRMIERRRLRVPHVESGAAEMTRENRIGQRRFVVNPAARGGDQNRAVLHLRIRCGIEQVHGVVVAWAV